MSIGPVDVAIRHFPGSGFTGEIGPALNTLVAEGTVRIIDLRVISKANDEIAGLDTDLQPQLSQVTVTHSGQPLDDEEVDASIDALVPGQHHCADHGREHLGGTDQLSHRKIRQ